MTPNKTFSGRIADLSNDDKPREKALKHGIRALSNAELIAIIFGGGVPGKSVIDLSKEILNSCNNSLSALAGMSMAEVSKKYHGVGPAKSVALAAAFELGFRCRDERPEKERVIRSSSDAYDIMRGQLEHLSYEEFWIMILSRSNRVKYTECISSGGTAATLVDIKLMMKIATDKLASALILVHNHPSGNLRPSIEDDRLTKRIKDAAELLDMKVLDHLIITPESYFSYSDEGKL